MKLDIPKETFEAIQKAGAKSKVFEKDGRHHYRDIEIETRFVLPDDFKIIKKIVKQPEFWEGIKNRRIWHKIQTVEKSKADDKGKKITKLELLADKIHDAIAKSEHKWIFDTDSTYESMMAYFVSDVSFHPAERRGEYYKPAYVSVTGKAISRGDDKSKSYHFERDRLPATVEEIFRAEDTFIETSELYAAYQKELKKYHEESPKTGEQFLAKGKGVIKDGHWHRDAMEMEKDGEPSKVVMDDILNQDKDAGVATAEEWEDEFVDEDEDEVDEDSVRTVKVPIHPIVQVFSLSSHDYVDCHISDVELYKYDAALIGKLVLPKSHGELVDALTGSVIERMSDVIKGKAQGIIILCSGKPGTGKTLTAEVYSEAAKRPLYMVQCSQLGTDEEELEKKLVEVLDRANRWKAILLIDEADVYIHERGSDIGQNAIVGVFLRLLEYYNGILFMNTNRETIVDDAILSRATAHIKYTLPEGEDLRKLWSILANQYKLDVSSGFIAAAIEEFPNISGRSIRQLIRLAKIECDRRRQKVTVNDLKWAAKFHDFTELEDQKE